MAVQFSVAVRNGKLDGGETAIGTSPVLRLRTGAPPANCAAADSGSVLASVTLASDWAAAAANGSKALNNLPIAFTGSASGVIGHYRLYASDGTTCHEQGTVGTSAADLIVDNTSLNNGQGGSITGKTQTEGNA